MLKTLTLDGGITEDTRAGGTTYTLSVRYCCESRPIPPPPGLEVRGAHYGAKFRLVTLDDHFAGLEKSRRVFDALAEAVGRLGDVGVKVTRTQVAFRRRVSFAYAWVPEKHLGRPAAPLVLTVALQRRDPSPRWKEVVEPAPGRLTHHLELRRPDEVDEEVAGWLREAWEGAV